MKKTNEKGFTLVELLVVVSIIGLLSTLAIVALGSARTKARDAKRVSDMRQIATALEMYFSDNDYYPSVASAINLGEDGALTFSETNAFNNDGAGIIYMGSVPKPPTPPADKYYVYKSLNTDETDCTEKCASYEIEFELEGKSTGLEGELKITPEGMQVR